MKARSKTSKLLDIVLSEEKFYFPGETIRGSIVVKPKNAIRANQLILKFSGDIHIASKEKEVLALFETCKNITIHDPKLEVKVYSFPFEFLVPHNLPSAMNFGKNKTARIIYKLTVILDRPIRLQSLCPKFEYHVSVMEYLDVTKDNFIKSSEKQKEHITSKYGKCHAKLSVPRIGFTRGETIPVNIIINTFQSFVKKDALLIELVRKVKIQTPRNKLDEEHVLKANKFDLNIIGPYNFSQSISSQILIRATPPTIRYKERVLRVHYKIRAQLFTDSKKKPSILLELPIVVGTWPRADIPIDDDDDDDIIQNMGELMISEEGEYEEDELLDGDEGDYMTTQSSFATAPSPTSTISMKYPNSYYTANSVIVKRSGSNNSLGSVSSWRSQSTSDQRLSSNTSPTSASGGSVFSSHIPDYQRNTLPPVGFKMSNGYLNRSSSTPDLLSNSPATPSPTLQHNTHTRTRIIDPTIRSSYYESSSSPQMHGHRPSKSVHLPQQQQQQQQQQQYHHRRIGSDEYSLVSEPEVPNHTLTFLSSSTPTSTLPSPLLLSPPPPVTVTQASNMSSLDESSYSTSFASDNEDDDDDDDSDDDLFAIIEKKKKQEEKELKKRQRLMYTLNE